jgi:hypothetical protein
MPRLKKGEMPHHENQFTATSRIMASYKYYIVVSGLFGVETTEGGCTH